MLKLSIIIPMYNVELYIERCLLSCLFQDIPHYDYEIIVVNDGSSDCSLSIAERIAKQYKNIQIISQENKGLSEARNTGFRNASAKYIWFVDSDDTIKKDCLNQIIKQCESYKLELLAISAADVIDGKVIRKCSHPYSEVMKGVDVLEYNRMICCVPFTIYRRDFLIKYDLTFYPGIYYEDTEFSPRSYFYAERVGFTNEILYFYTSNPSSITKTINPKKAFDRLIVMDSIDNFYKTNMQYACSTFIHNYLSVMFNNALLNFVDKSGKDYLLKDYEMQFIIELIKRPFIISHLLKSSSLKYRIEGVFLKLFPRYIVKFYKFLRSVRS